MASSWVSSLSVSGLLPDSYVRLAEDAQRAEQSRIQHLITHRVLPEEGWSEPQIISLLDSLSSLDMNNLASNCGVGEREGRVHSNLVWRRHFGLVHGIGRSGDVCQVQPKAAGSSTLNGLTNCLLLNLVRKMGVRSCQSCFVVPVATGMALTLCLLALRKQRKESKYVLWSRIDQKACFKSILAAGFEPIIIELKSNEDEWRTDLDAIKSKIEELGSEKVLCFMSTTSCFAPRAADNVVGIAKLLAKYSIPQLINNAYGLQSYKLMHEIEMCGKEDNKVVFVQSLDKNLMVPVGGSIVAGFDGRIVAEISQTYPGRAASTPTIDAFITVMSMGANGYTKLVRERKQLYTLLKTKMQELAMKYGERVLETKNNPISIAMTLNNVDCGQEKEVSEIGSMLFTRAVSGARVVTGQDKKTIDGYTFQSWGSNASENVTPYLTAAAAIGMREDDINVFIKRLDKVLKKTKIKDQDKDSSQ